MVVTFEYVMQKSAFASFLSLLGLMFIGLKLTGYIDWSWWWVLLPLWGPWAVVGVIAVLWYALYQVLLHFETPEERRLREARKAIEDMQKRLKLKQ